MKNRIQNLGEVIDENRNLRKSFRKFYEQFLKLKKYYFEIGPEEQESETEKEELERLRKKLVGILLDIYRATDEDEFGEELDELVEFTGSSPDEISHLILGQHEISSSDINRTIRLKLKHLAGE